MNYFITGGAGFVGSHLVAKLLNKGHQVTAYDNLILGREAFLKHHTKNPHFKFIKGDLLDVKTLTQSLKGYDFIFHLAANSDIAPKPTTDTDLKLNTLATYNVLEAMRLNTIKKIAFSSTSAVYGVPKMVPTPEDYGPLFPISFYGASKVSCEALISAFCHNFGMRAWVFRFANIIGKNATHGVMVDFVKKLQKNPKELEILGDGKQKKCYLYIDDCIEGMLFGIGHAHDELNYFNLATKGNTEVNTIAKTIIHNMKLKQVTLKYTGGSQGWKGDVPTMELDCAKLKKLGWKARYTSDEAVKKGVEEYVKGLKKIH